MFSQFINWRTSLAVIAIAIVTGTIFYSNYLSKKIAADERRKVNIWAESLKTRSITTDQSALNLTNIITNENVEIPIIETDEKDRPTGNYLNIEPNEIKSDTSYLTKKLEEFKSEHEGITVEINKEPLIYNKYYYGDSDLLKEVRYYPIIQLVIVAFFIIITLIAISTRNKSTQNQVWAGMAKETAHQIGTPLSSLIGWVEIMKADDVDETTVSEIEKDINRLQTITDRFSKIGSEPVLEDHDLIQETEQSYDYLKSRTSKQVEFTFQAPNYPIHILMNPALHSWTIENLVKNAIDAMKGKGKLHIAIEDTERFVKIKVSDTGSGIPKKLFNSIFDPGFTTKKRGWGLGLSLTKRIVEEYHSGKIKVAHSEIGKGTTMQITFKKAIV